MLLILAGVAISAITGNENAMEKAKEAKIKDDIATAKDAAALKATEYVQDFMEKKYVNADASVASISTAGQYVAAQMPTQVNGDYKYEVDGTGLTVKNKTTNAEIVTGSILTNGSISWDDTVASNPSTPSNPSNPTDPTEPEATNTVETLAKSGAIKRWDKVNYNPGTATTASINLPEGASIEGTKLASINLPDGASLESSISADSASNWVVLDVNETTGEVLIMPRTVSDVSLTLTGKDGYNNAIEAIDAVAGIYKNNSFANSARGLRVEDINKVMEHNPDGEKSEYTWNHRYGMNPTTLDITDTESDSDTPSQTYTSTAETGYYYYSIASVFGYNNNCWLASRCVRPYFSDCYFSVRYLVGGHVDNYGLFGVNSGGSANEYGSSCPVVPVVSLKSNIQMESASTFYTETATATVTVAEQDETHQYEHNTWNLSLGTN